MAPSTQNRMLQIWENQPVFSREPHPEKCIMGLIIKNSFDYCPARQLLA